MADFDLLVIGAGAAGLSVAAGAAQLGVKTALVERHVMGGDCLNTGCVPSKALLAAAHVANAIRASARFGIAPETPKVDWDAVRTHVMDVIATIAPVDSAARFTALGVTVIEGEARFTGPDAVSVNGRVITANRFVIAAGSRAAVPPIPGLDGIPHWTNADLFNLQERPEHLLVLGGGPIGLEMADAFSGLGCQVTVIEAGTIANREEPELVDTLRGALRGRGITILEGAAVKAARPGPELELADGRIVTGTHVLVATGRRPNLEALNLPAARVAASARGVVTDAGLRSPGNKRVYAVGDIADPIGIGPRAFTHVGLYHAGIIIRRALFHLPAKVDYSALPRVTYTEPELAHTGLTEAEARAAGLEIEVLRWPLAENDRAIAERSTTGHIKLIVRRGKIIGAGILAPHAGEMIGQWTLAISRKIPLSALAGMIVPYPTYAEIGKRAAGSYFTAKLFSARTKALVRFLGRLF